MMDEITKLKRTNMLLTVLLAVCIIAVVVLAVVFVTRDAQNTEEPSQTADTGVTDTYIPDTEDDRTADMQTEGDKTTAVHTEEEQPTDEPAQSGEDIMISTPYCTLKYPAMWSDYLSHEGKESGGVYTEEFYCSIKGQKIKMFTVIFGESKLGASIGYINKDGAKIPFRVMSEDAAADPSWTDDEKNVFYAMTEAINDVIASVVSNENYSGE